MTTPTSLLVKNTTRADLVAQIEIMLVGRMLTEQGLHSANLMNNFIENCRILEDVNMDLEFSYDLDFFKSNAGMAIIKMHTKVEPKMTIAELTVRLLWQKKQTPQSVMDLIIPDPVIIPITPPVVPTVPVV